MTALDPKEVKRLLSVAAEAATAAERGKTYEELLVYIFASVPGTRVVADKKNFFGAEQVDIAVSHGGIFPGVPKKFLVECKKYADPLDSKSVGYFLYICLSRRSEMAVIVAANGLSGDEDEMTYAHSLAYGATALGCRLIVLTDADLLGLTSEDDVVEIISRRYLEAFASGTIGT